MPLTTRRGNTIFAFKISDFITLFYGSLPSTNPIYSETKAPTTLQGNIKKVMQTTTDRHIQNESMTPP